jgi:polyhydroxybutyrate depolymerase
MKAGRLVRLALVAFLVLGLCTFGWACAHFPSSAEGHQVGELVSGGLTRTFLSVSPKGPGPFPLVIALHGRLGTGAQMSRLSRLTPIAQREGFIVVYPDGIDRSWADARGTSSASKLGVDDVAYLSALIDEFVAHRHADPARVFVVGMSNGGFMALTLACRLADKVAAVGSVTGLMGAELATQCAPSRPVAVALVLGDADPIVPFVGGELAGGRGPTIGAEDVFATWQRLDACPTAPVVTPLSDLDPDDGTRVERREAEGCRDQTAVRLDVVHGGGHGWPLGDRYLPEAFIGKTSRDLDASQSWWDFVKRFPR